MDIRVDNTDTLSPERAADLLGVSPRTVRRWIASGKLAGSAQPCATTRGAVDAVRRQQQARTGDVLTAADKNGALLDNAPAVMDAADVAYVVDMLAGRVQDLAREVGRLEAELAQARGAPGGQGGHKGHAAGALARLVPWRRG